ncbi:DUF2778 domain-containing protein [Neorhizobium sp. NCHU2750]|uniref:DUF2778 domain-containing protein n=1 Tax=Neorhizobium sp. NCHU2750 TaxID=1825976 RepID=UPI000EB6874C|nr:hypothetical protein NCHU2750_21030 [Neorhizobium sp. NCHU2750]
MVRKIETSKARNKVSKRPAKRKHGRSILANMAIGIGLTASALIGASVVTVATAVKPVKEAKFQTALLSPVNASERLVQSRNDRALDVSKFSRLPGQSVAEPKGGRLAGADVAALSAMRPDDSAVNQALHHAMAKASRSADAERQFAALANHRPTDASIRAVLEQAMGNMVVVAPPSGEGAMPDVIQDAQSVASVADLKDMRPVEMASVDADDTDDASDDSGAPEITGKIVAMAPPADTYALPKAGPVPIFRPSAGMRGDDDNNPPVRGSALAAIAAVAPQKPSKDDDKPTALAFAKPDNPMRAEPDAPSQPTPKFPGIGTKVAIYDITNGVVHMPDGSTLEAHSGIGEMRDNPKFTNVKMRGPTPPGTYKLSMREAMFHGVAAMRLTPVDGKPPQGRTGLLAHSFLLRVRGDSHGCVAFADYPRFLKAFQRGEITHMIIVNKWDGKRPGAGSNGGFLAKLFGNNDA